MYNSVKIITHTIMIRGINLKTPKTCIFTFNIIITNKNNTAIAPTYMIIKSSPKKSAQKIKHIAAAFKNVKTKNKIECTVFSARKTNNAESIKKQFKII